MTGLELSNYFPAMEAELRSNLLTLGKVYCEAADRSPKTIGMRVARDGRFFDRLEAEKAFTVKTYDTALQWFSDNWPEGLDWPSGIERPAPRPFPVDEIAEVAQ